MHELGADFERELISFFLVCFFASPNKHLQKSQPHRNRKQILVKLFVVRVIVRNLLLQPVRLDIARQQQVYKLRHIRIIHCLRLTCRIRILTFYNFYIFFFLNNKLKINM